MIGREWNLPPLKKGEVYLHTAVVPNGYSVVGTTVYAEISTTQFFPGTLWYELNFSINVSFFKGTI